MLGAIVYLITQVFTSGDVNAIQKEITSIVTPTKKIKDLEKTIEFADTYANRIGLADAYYEIKAYKNAISNYEKALEDEVQNSDYAYQQLVLCYFQLKDFNKVIYFVDKIKDKSDFKGFKQQFTYGLVLREKGELERAEEQLKEIDRPYSNYAERLELAKFYLENDRKEEGKLLLEEINNESKYLTKPNRRLFSQVINEVEQILKTL